MLMHIRHQCTAQNVINASTFVRKFTHCHIFGIVSVSYERLDQCVSNVTSLLNRT